MGLLLGVAITLAGIRGHQQLIQSEISATSTPTLNEPQYHLAEVTGDHESNKCWFKDTTMFNEEVLVVYPEIIEYLDEDKKSEVIGRWNADVNVIELMQPKGLTVQTVSHEVSHMVDTFMERYPGIDPHYEAYMQGYWTECIYQLMEYDIRIASE